MTEIVLDDTAAPPAGRTRDVRRLRRIAAAVILPLPAIGIATGLLFRPGYDADSTAQTLDAIAAAPGLHRLDTWLGALAVLTLVPAFLAASRLARRQRPVLAMLAAGTNTTAYLGTALGLSTVGVFMQVAAQPEYRDQDLAGYLDAVGSTGVVGLGVGLFVFGHILGAILLGAALWRSIPRWACMALIVSQPLHAVAFVALQNRYLDFVAWGLTGLGLTVCAVAVLRTPDDEWDLPPR